MRDNQDRLNQLKALTEPLKEALSMQVGYDNPDEITGKLQLLSSLMGTSASAIALAESVYNDKVMELAESNQWAGLTATDRKMIFAGKAKTEAAFVTLTNKLNSGLVHSIDALRSMLSYLKSEMQNLPQN